MKMIVVVTLIQKVNGSDSNSDSGGGKDNDRGDRDALDEDVDGQGQTSISVFAPQVPWYLNEVILTHTFI